MVKMRERMPMRVAVPSDCLRRIVIGAVVAIASATGALAGAKFQVVYDFAGGTGDGAGPAGPLLTDGRGSLYGVTSNGGSADDGTVFRISQRGKETVLHVFTGTGGEGSEPFGGVIADASGNLYGATSGGGINGLGIVFEVAPNGSETVLHTFQGICCGNSDGSFAYSSLVADGQGAMYGMTMNGGSSSDLGAVYRVMSDGTESVIHAFAGTDGAHPVLGGLAVDRSGVFYGAASAGGANGGGVAFRMTAGGTETILHQFGAGSDGSYPQGWIVVDKHDNMYGTTQYGGGSANVGIVYKIDANGVETILHVFNGADGGEPLGLTLVGDTLYGVAIIGGKSNSGTIFKIAPNGAMTTLHAFGGQDGFTPSGPLVADGAGNLYGTTYGGGAKGNGVVFKLTLKKKTAE
jgi:uncharacterized repeat protein (TIGR03803 family)